MLVKRCQLQSRRPTHRRASVPYIQNCFPSATAYSSATTKTLRPQQTPAAALLLFCPLFLAPELAPLVMYAARNAGQALSFLFVPKKTCCPHLSSTSSFANMSYTIFSIPQANRSFLSSPRVSSRRCTH